MSKETILFLAPSLSAGGGGIEVYVQQFVEVLATTRPNARFVAVLAREEKLQRPELLSAELRARLRVYGTDRAQRFVRVGEFMLNALRATLLHRPTMIVCGHVNFNAMAHVLQRLCGAKLISLVYGIEAWNITSSRTANALCNSDRVISISKFTANNARENDWSRSRAHRDCEQLCGCRAVPRRRPRRWRWRSGSRNFRARVSSLCADLMLQSSTKAWMSCCKRSRITRVLQARISSLAMAPTGRASKQWQSRLACPRALFWPRE